MQTESYLRTEVTNLFTEAEDLEQWKTKCEELGLDSQLNLVTNNKSPIPFPLMTKDLNNIYSILFNRKVKLTEYDKEPIPLDLLGLIALSKQEEYFNQGIQIWYSESVKDPIIVGRKGESSWNADNYIIGRWGDVLLDIATLRKLAAEKLAADRVIKLKQVLKNIESAIENCQEECESFMMGNEIKTYFSV